MRDKSKIRTKDKIIIMVGVNKTLAPSISCFFAMGSTRKKEKLVYLMSVIFICTVYTI
jgi:hypothetical protein